MFDRWRKRSSTDEVWFSDYELQIALALVAGLDPEKYKHPAAKALIYKTKAAQQKATI
jgi:hypothetical protein